MSRNFLSKNQELLGGDYLLSNNGEWKAVFQEDSNFVIYGWKPVWASDTCGSGAVFLYMQQDGNLVMYNKDGQPRWQTNSCHKCNNCRLTLTNDGKLMLCKDICNVWNSDKNKGMK